MCQDTCPVESGICWVGIVKARDDLRCCLSNSAVVTVPDLFIYVFNAFTVRYKVIYDL